MFLATSRFHYPWKNVGIFIANFNFHKIGAAKLPTSIVSSRKKKILKQHKHMFLLIYLAMLQI